MSVSLMDREVFYAKRIRDYAKAPPIFFCPWLCLANAPMVSNVELRGSTHMSDSQQLFFISLLYRSLSRIPIKMLFVNLI